MSIHTSDAPAIAGVPRFDGDDHETLAWRARNHAEQNERLTAAMRDAADIIEACEVARPAVSSFYGVPLCLEWTASDRDAFRELTRALGSMIAEPWRKQEASGRLKVARDVGDVRLVVTSGWQACEQVQVGTKVETVEKVVEPAVTRTVEETVPVLEWRCGESLLDGLHTDDDR